MDKTADHTIIPLQDSASFMGSRAWCSDQVRTITGQASLWRSSLQTSRNRRTTHRPDSTSSRPCHPCKLRRGLLLKAGTLLECDVPVLQATPISAISGGTLDVPLLMPFYEVYGIFSQYYLITQIVGQSPDAPHQHQHRARTTLVTRSLCRDAATNCAGARQKVLSTSVVALRQASRTYACLL